MEALWEARASFDCRVDVSKGIWAKYVCIDGIRYLAALSNDEDGAGPNSYKLVDADRASRSSALYVLEDHLGIRHLVFVAPGESARLPSFDNAKPGPW
jgi:hypothetical protein